MSLEACSNPAARIRVDCRDLGSSQDAAACTRTSPGCDSDSLSHVLENCCSISSPSLPSLCLVSPSLSLSSVFFCLSLYFSYLSCLVPHLSLPLSPSLLVSFPLPAHLSVPATTEAETELRNHGEQGFGTWIKQEPTPDYVALDTCPHLSVIQPGPGRGAQCPSSGHPAMSNLDWVALLRGGLGKLKVLA